MKTMRKSLLALIMAAAMMLSLTACDDGGLSTDEASQCIQAEMDTTYKGEFEDFLAFYSNMTKSDAQDQYVANLEGEANYFFSLYGVADPEDSSSYLAPSDALFDRAVDIYKDIYAKSSYEVKPATKQEDGTLAVKVVVKPIDIITQVDDSFDDAFADFAARQEEIDIDAMTEEEALDYYVNTYAEDFYTTLLDLLESKVASIGYLDEKSIVIQVEIDDESFITITDDDWMNLDRLIIDYNF